MALKNPTTDVIHRVWVENENAHLEIRPFPDAPDTALEVTTSSHDGSKHWFGDVSITMSPAYARELGKALIAAANEMQPE